MLKECPETLVNKTLRLNNKANDILDTRCTKEKLQVIKFDAKSHKKHIKKHY